MIYTVYYKIRSILAFNVSSSILAFNVSTQPSPSRSEASARKKSGCSTRLGPRCDVTAKGAPERLADFNIFNMAENLYIKITL